MRRRDFERVVLQAVESLPPIFKEALENIDIQVQWRPTIRERRQAGLRWGQDLFGLYVGVPLPKRSHYYSMVLPDAIIVYQRAHERHCRTEEAMVEQIRQTVIHEIGHYMGIDEDRLRELGVG
jgi:predicted Zn-dependent protease with MMP-like domain